MGRMIDVREYPEFAGGHIAGSHLVPLAELRSQSGVWNRDEALTLVCKSGRRAQEGRRQLNAAGFTKVSVLEGGVDRWREDGHALVIIEGRPWSMERQIRIVAGSLVLLTLVLAETMSRYFLLATALVGAGLVFAGVSDLCMMAWMLARLPWNRPARVNG